MTTVVGRSIPRCEAPAKVRGRARYVADLVQPGMLHARLVRSPYPHARVIAIDAGDAARQPGVVQVLTRADLDRELPRLGAFDAACAAMEREPDHGEDVGDTWLFPAVARFVGEPVAMVLAESEGAAAAGASMVVVDFEPLEAVLTPEAALADDAPVVHAGAAGNVATRMERRIGDPDAAFAGAAMVVERTFTTSRQKQAQLEMTACLAAVDADGRITVWTPHQAPHRARYTIARMLDVPAALVRVIVPTVGGAFGKNDALTAEPYAIVAALITGRPVRLAFTRQEDFVGTESRHPTRTEMSLALRADGTILAVRARSVVDAGAYLSHSKAITAVLVNQMLASYRIDHADIEAICAFTHTPVTGAFRGYGGPQAALPMEHLLDLGCGRLGVDPVQARMAMRLRPGDPWGYRKEPLVGDGFRECLERGAAAIGWTEPRAREVSPTRRRGVGVASAVWKSGIVGKGMDHSAASVRLTPDGSVLLLTAAADLGTGIRTTLAQICAEALGFPVERITVVENDTDVTPYDTGAFASRTLFRAGPAVELAAREVRERLLAYAATVLEIDQRDLDLTEAAVVPRGAPDRAISLRALLRRALLDGVEFAGHGQSPQSTAPGFAAVFAEVEVDLETGQVEVQRLVAAQDVGKAINPSIVEGQIQGAVNQGMGYALTEGLVVDGESGTGPYFYIPKLESHHKTRL